MTAYTAAIAKSATPTAATADTVTLTGAGGANAIQIINRDATNALSVRVNFGTSNAPPTTANTPVPTALGDDCFVVVGGTGPASVLTIKPINGMPNTVVVGLFPNAVTPPYTVQAVWTL